MSVGKSLRLFFIDGTAGGLVTAEIPNWTGHLLTGPRSQLSELLKCAEQLPGAAEHFAGVCP